MGSAFAVLPSSPKLPGVTVLHLKIPGIVFFIDFLDLRVMEKIIIEIRLKCA